ncbi:MAG: peptidoglycan-binding domain-containing protein [Candidatus Sericytochromatia bacterium]|nr:peptidoglycan-binding domain-containing protein [Candidatus Sericytochromatia bacterium]
MSKKSLPTLALALATVFVTALPAQAYLNPTPVRDTEADAVHGEALKHGHHLKLDGKYGPLTEAAVRRFQTTHKLKVDGIIGTETRKALGLPAGEALRPGLMNNDEVRTAQRLLSHHEHIWHEAAKAKPAEAKPAPVAAKPAAPVARPAAPVAAPKEAAAPVVIPAAPTPEPWTPAPVVVAPSADAAAAIARSSFFVYGGNWFLPKFSSAYDFDWTMTKPAYMAGLSLWADDYGLAGDYTALPAFFVGPTQVLAAGAMYDGQVRWRDAADQQRLGLGYRNLSGNHLGTVSYAFDLPLVGNALTVRGTALGGTNFGAGWMADGRLGLGLGFGPFLLDGGWRAIGLSGFAGTNQLVWTQAPYANLGLKF